MKKITKKKPFILSVGGWKFHVEHAYKEQEKLARHQAEVIRKALSKDAIAFNYAAYRAQLMKEGM